MTTDLSTKIEQMTAAVGVIGLGYVGLPIGVAFGKIGYRMIGVDLSQWKIDRLNEGQSYIPDVPTADIAELRTAGRLSAHTTCEPLAEADIIFICVPTPFNAQKAPDLSFVEAAADSLSQVLRPGQLVILQSTTYPGTTTEIVLPRLESSGLKVGRDFHLAFSPERIDPGHVGSQGFDVYNTPKVVGGVTQTCTEHARHFLAKLTRHVHPVSSPAVAEMSKLLENTFRSVNIALVNELTLLSDRMGIDIWEVIEAAGTKPFGFMPFYPGPGVGGHCIPVDPYYLSWKAREYDFYTKFIELAAEINSSMPYFTVEKVAQTLNDAGVALKGANILILGVAFKRDIDDARNSPAERVIEILLQAGAKVQYHDPHVSRFQVGGSVFYADVHQFESQPLTEETLAGIDCSVIITGHRAINYAFLATYSKIVVDAVNVTQTLSHPNIVRMGGVK